mmetsp:Transcript_6673/g.15229  ORF Transcript_6673/g.15229 Transcript_6673/m.15229 type:complete len:205 (-) Transcript_6673:2255-2869(-)
MRIAARITVKKKRKRGHKHTTSAMDGKHRLPRRQQPQQQGGHLFMNIFPKRAWGVVAWRIWPLPVVSRCSPTLRASRQPPLQPRQQESGKEERVVVLKNLCKNSCHEGTRRITVDCVLLDIRLRPFLLPVPPWHHPPLLQRVIPSQQPIHPGDRHRHHHHHQRLLSRHQSLEQRLPNRSSPLRSQRRAARETRNPIFGVRWACC